MKDLPSYSSSVGRLEAHICFKVKYCHEIFKDKVVEKRCAEIFFEASEKQTFNLSEVGFDKNHVHLSADFGPNHAVKDVAKCLKGTSGRKLLKEFPELKKKYFWGSGLWSPVVYFESIGERDSAEINRYVRNQGQPREKPREEISSDQRTLAKYL